jgi:hypothetical protein
MYEDNDLWPIKCPECGNEFLEKVSRVNTGERIKCPSVDCSTGVWHPPEQFKLALAQANAGIFDPYGNMLRLQKPA